MYRINMLRKKNVFKDCKNVWIKNLTKISPSSTDATGKIWSRVSEAENIQNLRSTDDKLKQIYQYIYIHLM